MITYSTPIRPNGILTLEDLDAPEVPVSVTARRRQQGSVSLLERQASEYLDAADRLSGEIDALVAEQRLASTDERSRKINKAQANYTRLVHDAAEALQMAAPIREALGMTPHHLMAVADLLTAQTIAVTAPVSVRLAEAAE